jgi:ubiquinone/menaquinone biosynthesis C-methylase UbiE
MAIATAAGAAAARPNPERILQLGMGFAPTLIVEAALRHRFFDALDAGARTVDDVAAKTGASPRGVRAILNALVGLEFLTRDGNDGYALTPESSAFLVSGKPSFQGSMLAHASDMMLPYWIKLNDVVASGRPAFPVNQQESGEKFFIELTKNIFPMSYPAAQALADHLSLANATQPVSVLDVAAGAGVWGIALAQKSPRVTVTAVDWPAVLSVTREHAERFKVADRFRYIAGDIQTADLGTGYQLATLGHILHSEGAERSRKLLARVFEALAPGGRIAIAELVPRDDRTGPAQPLVFAVNMLVFTEQGDTFTFAEMSQWLTEAGFTMPRTLEAPGPSPLILATKPA